MDVLESKVVTSGQSQKTWITFSLISNLLDIKHIGIRNVYGIHADSHPWNTTITVPDISTNLDNAKLIFNLLVSNAVYPEHIPEVLEDLLSFQNF